MVGTNATALTGSRKTSSPVGPALLGRVTMDTNHGRARNRLGRLLIAATAVALLAALAGSPASAATVSRTQGDARAAFEALGPAGFTIPNEQGAPGGGETTGGREDVRIYPNASSSYCASGWHVISLSWPEAASNHENNNALFAYLSAVDIQYKWDGVPLIEERTAIKTFNNPDAEPDVYWFSTGAFMPPGSLTVGKHTLTTTSIDPLYPRDNGTWSVKVTILPC